MSETRRKVTFFVVAGFTLFVFLGVVNDVRQWAVFYPARVTVEATVTGNKETYYSKGQYRYHYTPIVSYNVNGVQYNDILLERGDVDLVIPYNVGTPMAVTVDGNNPRKILREPNPSTFVFAMLTFASGVMTYLMYRAGRTGRVS